MIKVKTSDLIGPALDWAVAKCEGWTIVDVRSGDYKTDYRIEIRVSNHHTILAYNFCPSTVWSQGGPISERERISVSVLTYSSENWIAGVFHRPTATWKHQIIGPTELIAKMRCYVASKLGDEVEAPDELVGPIIPE